jgi:hypothetical protein
MTVYELLVLDSFRIRLFGISHLDDLARAGNDEMKLECVIKKVCYSRLISKNSFSEIPIE